ncbi:MAG TPA: hypothetical protein VG963_25525, partial [Polyangiaceae bacterium]|nr:hypothetical protein [Polyangiaceae bacterium]
QPEPSAMVNKELSPAVRSLADASGKRAPPPELWRAVVDELRAHDPRWSAMFEHGVPHELSRERVVLVFPEGSFFGRQAESAGGLAALRRAAQKVLQGEPEVQVRFAAELRGMSLAQHEAAQLDERKEAIKRKALNHPRVLEAVKVFPELAQKQDIQVD